MVSGRSLWYLVHAVLLNPELAPVSMRGFGHVVQLLLLQGGVFCGHVGSQLVDAAGRRRLKTLETQRGPEIEGVA